MTNKLMIALIGLSLVACNFLFPARTPPPPEIKNVPGKETDAPETVGAPNPVEGTPQVNITTVPGSDDITVVRLHPEDGDLKTMLASEAEKAVALGQMPVVEFDATWCSPCQAIDQGLGEKNQLMLDAYAGTYIIKLDVDKWGWGNSTLHDFDFDGIPVYFTLDDNGSPTGKTVDGNAWGDNIPENIAPVMDKFFHGK